ncbi:MAG: 50S ribosomal protein L13 [Deltaproteobacteria bacterium]|nr:MAG: 50S ribosomal protein L13 [Deltaproteobacteria bacterium]
MIQRQTKSKTKQAADDSRKWWVVDAKGEVLGRLASRIAHILRGKHKVDYTPHVDGGDFVIVLNAGEVKLTGTKEEKKIYHHHTSWVGGIVSRPAYELRARQPEAMITRAVKGMLPKTTLGRHMATKLKVYPNAEHPHVAQQPETLALA